MKNIQFIKFLLGGIFLIISVGSCKKYLDGINTNPTRPGTITPAVSLPYSEITLAYTVGGDMSRFSSVFMQSVTGAARQMQNFSNYVFTEDDVNNLWLNLYSGPMINLHSQIALADKNGNKYFAGVSKILLAYSLGITTDAWGDAPYSDAFQGAKKLQPKYDSQQAVYSSIQQLLSDAVSDLSNSSGGAIKPGAEDVIFGGDVTQWKKFAYALSARFYIHLTKVNSNSAQSALDALKNGFSSSSDDAQVVFGTGATSAGPWYQYNDQRGDLSFINNFMIDSMIALKDPRVPMYADTSHDSKGNAKDALGKYFGSMDSPVILMTFFEQKFIEAEANNRLGKDADAQSAYVAAITASMQKVGVAPAAIATYLAANGTLTGTSAHQLDQIMFQKYLAMYLQPEAWSDWRRTGIPALKPSSGAIKAEIPRRLLYPQSERTYNKDNTPQSNLWSPKLWWDQ